MLLAVTELIPIVLHIFQPLRIVVSHVIFNLYTETTTQQDLMIVNWISVNMHFKFYGYKITVYVQSFLDLAKLQFPSAWNIYIIVLQFECAMPK